MGNIEINGPEVTARIAPSLYPRVFKPLPQKVKLRESGMVELQYNQKPYGDGIVEEARILDFDKTVRLVLAAATIVQAASLSEAHKQALLEVENSKGELLATFPTGSPESFTLARTDEELGFFLLNPSEATNATFEQREDRALGLLALLLF